MKRYLIVFHGGDGLIDIPEVPEDKVKDHFRGGRKGISISLGRFMRRAKVGSHLNIHQSPTRGPLLFVVIRTR